jgi:hypothetical protein
VTSNSLMEPFDLRPGGVVFRFPVATSDATGLRDPFSAPYLKAPDWSAILDFGQSSILAHMEDTSVSNIHMPVNAPSRDCRATKIFGRWLASLDALNTPLDATPAEVEARREARLHEVDVGNFCTTPTDVYWVGEDPTEKVPYTPRNLLWSEKIPQSYIGQLNLDVTPELIALKDKVYYNGFWQNKPGCTFPVLADSAYPAIPATYGTTNPEPWMLDANAYPLANWGTLYSVTPPASIFNGICAGCHGSEGDDQTAAAKTLVALKGYRVANFREGLFGPPERPRENLKTFSSLGPNGAAKYMAWMASGGTKVRFPPGFIDYWLQGRALLSNFPVKDLSSDVSDNFGGNMLSLARYFCNFVRTSSWPEESQSAATLKMWKDVCETNNELTPEIQNAGMIDDIALNWLDRATFNAGVMAYYYVFDELSANKPPIVLPYACDKRTP